MLSRRLQPAHHRGTRLPLSHRRRRKKANRRQLASRGGRIPREPWGVSPQIFETVEFAFFAVKNVYDNLQIIDHDPLTRWESIHGGSTNFVILLEPRFDFTRDRP